MLTCPLFLVPSLLEICGRWPSPEVRADRSAMMWAALGEGVGEAELVAWFTGLARSLDPLLMLFVLAGYDVDAIAVGHMPFQGLDDPVAVYNLAMGSIHGATVEEMAVPYTVNKNSKITWGTRMPGENTKGANGFHEENAVWWLALRVGPRLLRSETPFAEYPAEQMKAHEGTPDVAIPLNAPPELRLQVGPLREGWIFFDISGSLGALPAYGDVRARIGPLAALVGGRVQDVWEANGFWDGKTPAKQMGLLLMLDSASWALDDAFKKWRAKAGNEAQRTLLGFGKHVQIRPGAPIARLWTDLGIDSQGTVIGPGGFSIDTNLRAKVQNELKLPADEIDLESTLVSACAELIEARSPPVAAEVQRVARQALLRALRRSWTHFVLTCAELGVLGNAKLLLRPPFPLHPLPDEINDYIGRILEPFINADAQVAERYRLPKEEGYYQSKVIYDGVSQDLFWPPDAASKSARIKTGLITAKRESEDETVKAKRYTYCSGAVFEIFYLAYQWWYEEVGRQRCQIFPSQSGVNDGGLGAEAIIPPAVPFRVGYLGVTALNRNSWFHRVWYIFFGAPGRATPSEPSGPRPALVHHGLGVPIGFAAERAKVFRGDRLHSGDLMQFKDAISGHATVFLHWEYDNEIEPTSVRFWSSNGIKETGLGMYIKSGEIESDYLHVVRVGRV